MAHIHPVFDADTHFVIDPITRTVINAHSKKVSLMQYDHNSEVFSFEIPRYVEEHDMLLCDKVEVHYINTTSSGREKSVGIYEVVDLHALETDDNVVLFSWLVSKNATMFAGPLNFLIIFACTENGMITYRWSSGINKAITISSSINNSEAIIDTITENYPDIIEEWKYDITTTINKWREYIHKKSFTYEQAVINGFVGTEAEWYESLRGPEGEIELYVGSMEPSISEYFWFDTSGMSQSSVGDLTLVEDGVGQIYIKIDDKLFVLEGGTLDSDIVTEGQYNFDII